MSYSNYKNYNQYVNCCKPIGAQGEKGDNGAIGPVGPIGPSGGAQGAQGATGAQGTPGATGVQAVQGASGVQGAQGIIGTQGDTGATGAQGDAVNPIQTLQYSITLVNATGINAELTIDGVLDDISLNQTTTHYNTDYGAYNSHVFIDISSVVRDVSTDPIDITIRGTTISESTGVPVFTATETISIPSSFTTFPNGFQTSSKWLYVKDILFSNVSSIDYDIKALGYLDFLNTDVNIIGYRAEILGAKKGDIGDITLIIHKVKNDVSNKNTSLLYLENITLNDPSGQIVDNLRTGPDDRSYTTPVGTSLWPEQIDFVLKQTDFGSYFSGGGEYIINGTAGEGLIVKFESKSGFDSFEGPQYISLKIYYQRI